MAMPRAKRLRFALALPPCFLAGIPIMNEADPWLFASQCYPPATFADDRPETYHFRSLKTTSMFLTLAKPRFEARVRCFYFNPIHGSDDGCSGKSEHFG